MMHPSVQPRDRVFVQDYGLLSFAKNMSKNIGKNIHTRLKVYTEQETLTIFLN